MPLDDEVVNLHSSTSNPLFANALYEHHRGSMHPEDESVRGQALALYDFEPENPNELRLREGQTVNVAYRNGHGWLVAEDPTSGEQGLVPEEYVRLVREIEGWDAERGGFIDEDAEDVEMDESTDEQETPNEQDGGVPVGGILGGQANGTGENIGAPRDVMMTDPKSTRNSTILSPISANSTAAKRSADNVS